MEHILLDGPWSVNGIILQLSQWKPFFEPSFAKLSTAAIWVQFHNLPVKFWDGDTLESISSHLGILLKIDELTMSLTRSKFARVCLEIDLAKPLSQGFWLGDDVHRVFVVVQYERLPIFCYNCGLIGHGSNSCSCSVTSGASSSPPPPCSPEQMVVDSTLVSPVNDQRIDDIAADPVHPIHPPETDFGLWILVSRRHGGARGHGGGSRVPCMSPNTAADP